jgi:hypothetical protein
MKRKSLLIMLLAALFMPLALHAQQSLPYSYGFEENDDTEGWAIYGTSDGTGVYQGEGMAHGGTLFFGFQYDETNGYLVSPIFSGTDNGLNVSFWYKEYSTTYGDEHFQVGYTTDESVEDPSQFTYEEVITASLDWQEYTNTFPTGTKRIAVKYIYNDVHYLFLDDFEFTAPGAAVCNRPTGLTATNVGSRTATINWTSDASAWQICVNDDEAHLINVNQTSYTLSGLTPETNYTVKVRTNCGNNNFSAWTNVSFTTEVACPAPGDLAATDITSNSANISWTSDNNSLQLQYRKAPASNDFEDGTLGNWTTIDADGDGYEWYVLDASTGIVGHNESNGFATSASYQSVALYPDNYLVSPQITLGGSISFYACAQDADWAAEHFGVAVSTSGNTNAANFTTIAEWTLDAEGNGTREQGAWGVFTVDLSSYSGQGYVAIRHFNCSDKFRINVDDITIVQPGVTEPQPWTTINNASNPQQLTGLTPETSYQVQVRSNCGSDGYSTWTNAYFTTLPSCIAPARLTITDITTNSAVVSWTGNANSYNLKVNDQTYNNVTSPYTLSNLTAATAYTVEVQSVCSATSTSTWTSTDFVTEFCEEADKCLLTFVLTDSYGDTWNGNGIAVVDAATNVIVDILTNDYDNYTATGASGAYTQTKTLAVCNGRQLQFVWVAGSYPGEASWTISDVNGEEINSGTGSYDLSTGDILATYTVDCTITSCRKPTNLQATEITANSVTLSWTENGDATEWVVSYSSGVRPTTVNVTETTVTIPVSSETYYTVRVRPECDVNNKWSDEISFTTPSTCPLPSDITVDEGTTSATLSWSELTDVDSYNVRYCVPIHGATLLEEGFENGLGNWTTIDADGDGNNWFLLSELTTLYTYYTQTPEWQHVGNDAILSGSYINGAGALNADNWLITPQVTLGGMATFYARSIMADYPEQISVYVSTNSTNVEDFVLLNTWTPGAEWTQYMVDLSAYAGQGYIAIRNQGYDQYIVSIDDFVVEAPAQQNWIATLSTSENSITITGLQMSTTYAYQIQSVCNTEVWTAMDFFTTLGGNVFITDGNWGDDNDWSGGATPEEGSSVIIKANVTIPAGYTAIADQITIDGGSITIADGGQLKHNTDDLEVTMKKNVTAYTGAKDNYKLLSFPFTNYPDVPESMISTTGTDFYGFNNSAVDEEWQNNQVSAISYVYPGPGYLYANPEGLDLSMTGTTFSSYDDLYMTINYDENENGDNSGWRLIGNPFTCNAYIYDQDDNDMEVMFYDENGNMQTLVGGPVAPMQGFFVKVSDTTTVNFTTVEPGPGGANIDPGYNKSAISLDKKMHKTAAQAISFDKIEYKNVTVLDKKAEKPFIVLDKTMVKKLAKKDAYTRLKKEVKPFKPIKK